MRLIGARLSGFRSLGESPQWVPLGGLTVLYGGNSSGKTNVLGALEAALSPRTISWWDDDEDRVLEPVLFLELDGREVSGHPDEVLLEQLLLGKWGDGGHVRILGDCDQFHELIGGASADEVLDAMVSELVAGRDTDSEERRQLATHLIERARVLQAEPAETWLVCRREDLPADIIEAAALIAEAASEDENDELALMAQALLTDGRAYVECVGAGILESSLDLEDEDGSTTTQAWTIAEVLTLEYSSAGVESAVVTALNDGYRHIGHTAAIRGPIADAIIVHGLHIAPEPGAAIGPELQRWINHRDIDGVTWARVDPLIEALADLVGRRATEILPTFVRDQGRVVVSVRPLSDWALKSPVEVRFLEVDGVPRPLDRCGAGTRRWAAAALRLACADLVQATWTEPLLPPDDDGARGVYDTLRGAAAAGAMFDVTEPIFPDRVTTLLVADEPEANLHPRAVESVVEWLVAMSRRTAGVVVATHHPEFLTLGDDDSDLVHVHRLGSQTTLTRVAGGTLDELDELAVDVGLTRADLLQRTRMLLFVEGPHDQSVLDAYIGKELAQARVLVLPMHGTHNALALVDSELATVLAIPIGVLIDNATRRATPEELAVDRLQREARAAGVEITKFGIGKPDIIHYLNEDVCREFAPEFPGWQAATQVWRRERVDGEKFKAFVTARWGLRLDRRSVDRLARRSAATGTTPNALVRIAKEVTAAANEASSRRWRVSERDLGG